MHILSTDYVSKASLKEKKFEVSVHTDICFEKSNETTMNYCNSINYLMDKKRHLWEIEKEIGLFFFNLFNLNYNYIGFDKFCIPQFWLNFTTTVSMTLFLFGALLSFISNFVKRKKVDLM